MAVGRCRRPVFQWFPLALLLLVRALPLEAQEVGGSLDGQVLDEARAGVPAALVTLTGPALQGRRFTVSDANGRFRIPFLPVGAYELRVSRQGYHETVLDGLIVELGRATEIGDCPLAIEAVPVAGSRVAAERAAPAPRATGIGGSMGAAVFRALPGDRDYQSIVTLLPHASPSYAGDRANVAGTSGPETNYFVDGMNVVEPPGNAVSTSLPYNFVEAIDVRAGGYPAEYGGAGGGLVNAVTAAGGDAFRGQVFGFFANRLFTSSGGNLSVLPNTADYASWDAGASVSGPITRDRLWYFLAFNPAFESADLRLPGFGIREDVRRMQRFAGKLSARLDDRTRLVLAAVGDPSARDQVGGVAPPGTSAIGNLDALLATQRGGGAHVSLLATRVLGPRSFAEAAVTRSASRYSFVPSTARGASDPLFIDARTQYVEGGVGSSTDRNAGRSTARAALAWERGGHSLKLGAAYEDEYFRERLSLDQITRLGATLFQYVTLTDRTSRNHLRAPSAYLQDSWLAAPPLRVDLGLRWSEEYWIASGGETGQRIAGQWQPRAGVTWLLGARHATSVFGSAGRFIQRTRLNLPGFFLQDTPSAYLIRRYDHDPRLDPSGGTTVFAQTLGHQREVPDLRGAAYDQLEAGVEHRLAHGIRALARGVYRTQRSAIVGAYAPSLGAAAYGNPGAGVLAAYPEIARVYRALELTLDVRDGGAGGAGVTCTIASLRGNYEGYWDQSAGVNDPLGGASFVPEPSAARYGSGPLPGDRTLQLKGYASGRIGRRLGVGGTIMVASGAPINELGSTAFGAPYYRLLQPRGALGRTPAIYDLDLRLSYETALRGLPSNARSRLVADAYHLGNPRLPVIVDEVHYGGVDGSGRQISPNPHFGQPLVLQPAVAYRFGLEVSW